MNTAPPAIDLTDEALAALITLYGDVVHVGPDSTQMQYIAATIVAALAELQVRRAADSAPIRRLERSLAYEESASIIDGCCGPVTRDYDRVEARWSDIDDAAEFACEDVERAVRYLDARGLIERHPTRPNLILIRDEDEPGPPAPAKEDAHV